MESLTGALRATSTASSCWMPSAERWKRVTPAAWRPRGARGPPGPLAIGRPRGAPRAPRGGGARPGAQQDLPPRGHPARAQQEPAAGRPPPPPPGPAGDALPQLLVHLVAVAD